MAMLLFPHSLFPMITIVFPLHLSVSVLLYIMILNFFPYIDGRVEYLSLSSYFTIHNTV